MSDQPFNETAYDEARDALSYISTEGLEKTRALADTPTKAKALEDEIAERNRRT